MSRRRKWVLTTAVIVAWIIVMAIATVYELPFGIILLVTVVFGGLLGAAQAP